MRKGMFHLIIGSILTLSATSAHARQSFDDYVLGLKKDAIASGINAQLVDDAFKNVKYKARAVKADRNQPEKKLTLDTYIQRAVPKWKVDKAKAMFSKHKQLLSSVGEEYGVQPRYIVALWGIETNFGSLTGNFSVVNALTTMAYEGRRETFFKKELMSSLQILQEGHISLNDFKGSWAGAMGQNQFMPSSFLRYAVDGNQDGKKDIWNSLPDVFSSSANYLKQAGWNDNYTWGRVVRVPKGLSPSLVGIDKEKGRSLQFWQSQGIRKNSGAALPDLDITAWLIQPDDGLGRSYLVYGNYQSLLDWNRSHYFALAVSYLADRIKFG
ncbi:lytic murein transglycosylase [Veronia pacifica]|uniref:Lytic transglycosylase n=1 Tax=Veronia pacifica TaxID=1080227 RepID=A0A1C3ERL8_9GAMM|nr:lytic murein transglycosylase [Veronia pacifica]ODA35861.1 lytic transglycosylase [Veronia pacifica]